ncbi:hypothetical protein KM043_006515 [Ampulex compressa]|nr:hypothetical protein KM043_006515 [Ampulex compressa]
MIDTRETVSKEAPRGREGAERTKKNEELVLLFSGSAALPACLDGSSARETPTASYGTPKKIDLNPSQDNKSASLRGNAGEKNEGSNTTPVAGNGEQEAAWRRLTRGENKDAICSSFDRHNTGWPRSRGRDQGEGSCQTDSGQVSSRFLLKTIRLCDRGKHSLQGAVDKLHGIFFGHLFYEALSRATIKVFDNCQS